MKAVALNAYENGGSERILKMVALNAYGNGSSGHL